MELLIFVSVILLTLVWLFWKRKEKIEYMPNRALRRMYVKKRLLTQEESIGMGRYNKAFITFMHDIPAKLVRKFKHSERKHMNKLRKKRQKAGKKKWSIL